MSDDLKRYTQYVLNTGSAVMSIADFDDDWSPAGPLIRQRLREAGLIEEHDGALGLTTKADGL